MISYKIHLIEAISHVTVQIAQELDADAIVTVTESGFTARMIAKYRPKCYVVGVSRIPARVRAMQFYWGVRPLLGPSSDNTDEMIEISLKCAREHGYVKDGDSVVITAGVPVGKPGSTNLIKVVNVGNKLVSGASGRDRPAYPFLSLPGHRNHSGRYGPQSGSRDLQDIFPSIFSCPLPL